MEVIGNERISTETIAIFGDVSYGKDYDASDVNLLIKKLYESKFFYGTGNSKKIAAHNAARKIINHLKIK